ncbi:MAG: FtsW/RodA/SpoVE family cell cycle protein [Planctomycetota bacterium]
MSRRVVWLLLLVCLGITILGICGLARADELYGRTKLVEKQIIWLLIALPAAVGIGRMPSQRIQHVSYGVYIVCILLLIVTLFMPPINGSRRWIPLGLFDFQSSEPARLAYILALASWLMYRQNHRTVAGLLPPILLALIPMVLIVREPDLDTALLFVPICGAMLFAAGSRLKHLLVSVVMGVACLPILWIQMSPEQQSRIVSVVLQKDGGLAPAGDGFHLHQSKQVLALGGFWGSQILEEPPVDDPSAWQLPASRTDFVFVMIGERYGFPGCGLLLILYAVLIWTGLWIARQTREPFGRLVAIGIVTLIGEQTILNTGMTVGLLPITGTTLPLCSYGGSSLISTYVAIGLLISIGRSNAYVVTGEPFVFRREGRYRSG